MSSVIIAGNTSGTITLDAPAVAGTTTLTLPATSGTVLTSANIGSNLPTGSVLQVVSTTKTDVFSTSSTSFVDITGLSVSITPTSVSNKILVMVNASISKGTGGDVVVQLLRDSTVIGSSTGVTNNGFAQASVSYANAVFSGVAIYLDSPSSTSAITYKVQIKGDTATSYVNRRGQDANWGGASSITVMEIKG